MQGSSLGHRLRKLEGKTKHVPLVSSVRIIAWDEADRERQIAELIAAGTITPDMLVICRMIVPAGPDADALDCLSVGKAGTLSPGRQLSSRRLLSVRYASQVASKTAAVLITPDTNTMRIELGREPINSEWSADVRFGAHSGLKSDIA